METKHKKNHMHFLKKPHRGSHLGLKKTENAMQKTGRHKQKLYHYLHKVLGRWKHFHFPSIFQNVYIFT